MAFCGNCGTKIEGVAKFCPSCGTPIAAARVILSSFDDLTLKAVAAHFITVVWMHVYLKINAPIPVATVIAGINNTANIEGLLVDIGAAQVNPQIANMVTKADIVASLDKFDEVAGGEKPKGIIKGTVSSVDLGIGSAPAASAI
jgi:hypothetical protein